MTNEDQMIEDTVSDDTALDGNVADNVDDEDNGDGEDNHDAEIGEVTEAAMQPTALDRPTNMPDGAEHVIDDIWAWPTSDGCIYAVYEDFINKQDSCYGVGETIDDAIIDLQKDESTATEPNEATAVLPLDPVDLGNSPAEMLKIINKINEICKLTNG